MLSIIMNQDCAHDCYIMVFMRRIFNVSSTVLEHCDVLYGCFLRLLHCWKDFGCCLGLYMCCPVINIVYSLESAFTLPVCPGCRNLQRLANRFYRHVIL